MKSVLISIQPKWCELIANGKKTVVECDCVKFDYNTDYSVNFAECCDFMIRPPQSWCYVEELGC